MSCWDHFVLSWLLFHAAVSSRYVTIHGFWSSPDWNNHNVYYNSDHKSPWKHSSVPRHYFESWYEVWYEFSNKIERMLRRYWSSVIHRSRCLFAKIANLILEKGSNDGAVVRTLASQQCVPGSISGPHGAICWLSLLDGSLLCCEMFFSGRVPRFSPLLKNQHFQIPARTFLNEFLWTPWCSVGNKLHM